MKKTDIRSAQTEWIPVLHAAAYMRGCRSMRASHDGSYLHIIRNWSGVMPVIRLNTIMKCEALLKPQISAMSSMLREVVVSICRALRIRTAWIYWCGVMPRIFLN